MNLAALGRPVPITAEHDTSLLHSRHDSLYEGLRRRALNNATSGATRSYVDADAKALYARHGFIEPTQELTMMLGLRR